MATPILRVARPVSDLAASEAMYKSALGLSVLGRFEDHEGFDGVMLGHPKSSYHLEFTFCRTHPVQPTPTPEDLLVFYLPVKDLWESACKRMLGAGFEEVQPLNPYWEVAGRMFMDHDGYRVQLENGSWSA